MLLYQYITMHYTIRWSTVYVLTEHQILLKELECWELTIAITNLIRQLHFTQFTVAIVPNRPFKV